MSKSKDSKVGMVSRNDSKVGMISRNVGEMIISLQNKETPTEEAWDEFLKAMVSSNFTRLKILVITEGGGPTTGQRRRLQTTLAGRIVRVAVVTDSMKVRFIVSSVALLNQDICTFPRRELEGAYRYLDLSLKETHVAEKAIAEMERMMG